MGYVTKKLVEVWVNSKGEEFKTKEEAMKSEDSAIKMFDKNGCVVEESAHQAIWGVYFENYDEYISWKATKHSWSFSNRQFDDEDVKDEIEEYGNAFIVWDPIVGQYFLYWRKGETEKTIESLNNFLQKIDIPNL